MNIVFIDNRNYIPKTDVDSLAKEFIMLQDDEQREMHRYVPSFTNASQELAPHSYCIGDTIFGQMLTNYNFDFITSIRGTRGKKYIGYVIPIAVHNIFIINEEELDNIPEPRFVVNIGEIKFGPEIDMCVTKIEDPVKVANAINKVWQLMNIDDENIINK